MWGPRETPAALPDGPRVAALKTLRDDRVFASRLAARFIDDYIAGTRRDARGAIEMWAVSRDGLREIAFRPRRRSMTIFWAAKSAASASAAATAGKPPCQIR
jgi:hypothetical protein